MERMRRRSKHSYKSTGDKVQSMSKETIILATPNYPGLFFTPPPSSIAEATCLPPY